MSTFKKIKESDLVIEVPKIKKNKELQRTEKWRNDRKGRWTGTQMKSLMSCSSKGSKLTWLEFDKIFMFGNTVLKTLYENAMERKRDKYLDTGDGTKEMQYGTRVEPLTGKSVKKHLRKMKVEGKVKEIGFKIFPQIDTAGVSSDRILKLKGEVVANLEFKACTSWSTHFDRVFDLLDDKSTDFWQIQAQMIAWNVNVTYYGVSEPPKNMREYLYHDGDIMELYNKFKKDCPVTVQKVKASPIHQNALLNRLIICESIINEFLDKGGNLREIMYKKIDYYKKNTNELISFKNESETS